MNARELLTLEPDVAVTRFVEAAVRGTGAMTQHQLDVVTAYILIFLRNAEVIDAVLMGEAVLARCDGGYQFEGVGAVDG